MEGDDATRGDRNFFAGLGIAAGPLRLVAQLEIAEAGQLDAVARLRARVRTSSKNASTMSLASRLFRPTLSNSRSASSAFVSVIAYSPDFFLTTQGAAEFLAGDLDQFRYHRIHFGVRQGAFSILHNYPERKAFLPFRQTLALIHIEQSDLVNEGRRGRCAGPPSSGAKAWSCGYHQGQIAGHRREARNLRDRPAWLPPARRPDRVRTRPAPLTRSSYFCTHCGCSSPTKPMSWPSSSTLGRSGPGCSAGCASLVESQARAVPSSASRSPLTSKKSTVARRRAPLFRQRRTGPEAADAQRLAEAGDRLAGRHRG